MISGSSTSTTTTTDNEFSTELTGWVLSVDGCSSGMVVFLASAP